MTCKTCASKIVMLPSIDFVCDCNVRSVKRIASPETATSFRRAVAFLRGEEPRCDRCNVWDAVRLVECHLGCFHAQCQVCAGCTIDDTNAMRTYTEGRRNGAGCYVRPPQPRMHPPGHPDSMAALIGRLQ
jgi:hypothetical protein